MNEVRIERLRERNWKTDRVEKSGRDRESLEKETRRHWKGERLEMRPHDKRNETNDRRKRE